MFAGASMRKPSDMSTAEAVSEKWDGPPLARTERYRMHAAAARVHAPSVGLV